MTGAARPDLTLIVVTDPALAAPRSVLEVARAAVAAGAPAIQLRDKRAGARDLLALARALREATREAGALLFVNDRLDVALAADADGVHLGPHDLPVVAARRIAPAGFLIGASTDDPEEARRLCAEGADFLGCGTVWTTSTKADAGPAIGLEGLDRVARAVDVPVVGIGGITEQRSVEVATTSAAGVAVVGAVMSATDVGAAVRGLLAPWTGSSR
jgi:thiamine-phosphate pyrophosphorylase